MKKMTAFALVCAMSMMPQHSSAIDREAIKERIKTQYNETKDQVIKKMSAMFALLGGTTHEAQMKRVAFYQWVEEKNWWARHPKKWMTWIVTGRMPVKSPDNRVSDEQYVAYYIAYKELVAGWPLTEDEKDVARVEALEMLKAYRQSRGINQK